MRYFLNNFISLSSAWVVALVVGLATRGEAMPPPAIRVALVRGATPITIQAPALHCGPMGQAAEHDPVPLHIARIALTKAGFLVNEHFFLTEHLQCHALKGTLTVNAVPIYDRITIGRDPTARTPQLLVIEEMPMEKYLYGVVAAEMQLSWPLATLQAQTIAARSYALAQHLQRVNAGQPYDVLASVEDQVYRPGFVAPARIVQAVDTTAGQVLMQGEQIAPAYFHSCCGGHTARASDVWQERSATASSAVADPYCVRTPHGQWKLPLTRETLQQRLTAAGYVTPAIRHIAGESADAHGGRFRRILIETDGDPLWLAANEFRRIVGFRTLRSVWFSIRSNRKGWTLRGRGYGHGVGLCQWGAKVMAEQGHAYEAILQHYYPEATLAKVY